ncbi:uncharacterized protein ACA1_317660 [Acanthamoeba castellanii str. Neff]|uniref:Uncharacterized protein n=1 Tax=Acanthamoeba castellanii (strain ATCC 30010 / Neff) TaxID=1257118 RepID=L8H4L8_ACACF|nr:uncharacterized protein ACA1_317660 [Acanthamoeba castellanii str. Neff]ELR20474.1 hypothetical protein ACA1_317660 [Acanthamoeba castellanii str. Neff]
MADVVLRIADNVPYSRETKEGHPSKALGDLTLLRDIVLDADKIQAIGYEGIERCRAYAKHLEPFMEPGDIEECVVEHAEAKLVRLYTGGFICTAPGRAIAEPLHLELVDYLEDAKAKNKTD